MSSQLTFHTFSKQDGLNGAYFNKHNYKKAYNNLLLKVLQYEMKKTHHTTTFPKNNDEY